MPPAQQSDPQSDLQSDPPSDLPPADSRLGRSTAWVVSGTGLSRLAGLVRDVAVFTQLGVSPATDALVLALRIPAAFYRYFVDAGLIRLLVPQLVRAETSRSYSAYTADTLLPSVLMAAALAAAIGIFAPAVVAVLAPGFSADQAELAQSLLRLIAFYIPLALTVGYFTALLNSRRRYGVPAYMQVALNLAVIVAAIALVPLSSQPQHVIVGAVVAGGVLQVALLLIPLWRSGMLPVLAVRFGEPLRQLWRGIGAVLLVTLPQQLGLWGSLAIGSLLHEGALTHIYLAERLVQLPLALIGIAMATVVLPVLARQNADGQRQVFAQTLDWALKLTLLFAVPATLGLWLVADQIAEVIFGYRALGASQVGQIGAVTRAASVSLPFSVVTQIILAACFSRQDFKPMLISATAGAAVLLVASWLLAVEYGYGAVGIGLGVSLSALASATALVVMAITDRYWVPDVVSWLRLYLRMILGCVFIYFALYSLTLIGGGMPLPLLLLLEIVAGILGYLAMLRLTGLKFGGIWRYDARLL